MKGDPVKPVVDPANADALVYRLVRQHGGQAFVWGQHDCLLWALDVVHVLTGRELHADLRGHYATALQARRLLQRLAGAAGLQGLLTARLGPPLPAREPLRAGDVLLLGADACMGEAAEVGAVAVAWRGGAVGQADRGLRWLPSVQPVAAWRSAP